MTKPIWMPFYVSDYLGGTMHLTTEQHGAYLLLILHYWSKGEPLPDDDEYLAAVTKLQVTTLVTYKDTLKLLFKLHGGKWHHERIDKELLKAKKKLKAQSEGGKKSAQSKKGCTTIINRTKYENLENSSNLTSNLPSNLKVSSQVTTQLTQVQSQSQGTCVCANSAREVLDVELPAGFPSTQKESVEACMTIGCPEEFASKVWDRAYGRGGRDNNDVPIRSWPHHLSACWKYEREKISKNNNGKPKRESSESDVIEIRDFMKKDQKHP